MSEQTAISWCDSTFNPWIGCTKVSPACDHCYAERLMDSRLHRVQWGAGQPRVRTSAANWRQPLLWNREAEAFELAHGRRRRVFCASLADVFDNEVPAAWRRDLFDLIELTPNVDWLLLTKRIGNVADMVRLAKSHDWMAGRANVWLGATICNQAEADRDIPKLLATPAAVRFLSIEPMLGPVDLTSVEWPNKAGHRVDVLRRGYWNKAGCLALGPSAELGAPRGGFTNHSDMPAGIDWVICGGESGPQARPMHPDWVRSLRDQCAAAGVPFHFKQWGEWKPIGQMHEDEYNRLYVSRVKARPHEDQGAIDDSYGRRCTVQTGVIHHDASVHGPAEPMAFLQGTGAMQIFQVGTKAAGRLLDGRTHDEFPA